jgi:ABC-type antimicrobial peptide transport system permease subunit
VFYLSYIWSELRRRKGRTIVTLLGLAVGVALVIVISSLSRGLDRAQKTALNPLSSIGTDLTVTLAPQQNSGGGFGGGGFGGGGGGFGGGGGAGQVIQDNSSVLTDLAKLGKPGQKFVHDFFLPGTQLTFPASQSQQIAKLSGVSAVSPGLVLSAVHQSGTVPKIVAKLKAGGQRLTVTGRVRFQFSAAEQAKVRACIQKLVGTTGSNAAPTPNAAPGAGGGLGAGGGGRLGGGGGAGGGFNRSAFAKCLPAQIRNFRRTVTTPQQIIQQVVNPPQTNIKSSTYSIAGVDTSSAASQDIGLVTPSLLSSGKFLSGPNQVLVADGYAAQQKLDLGSTLDLNGTKLQVVGFVKPPLGGQSADVYVSLQQLQTLATQKNLANVVLVRATSSHQVAAVQREIQSAFPNAQVASNKQDADQINGSLVSASNLSHRLGIALAALAAVAAFLLATLLTLSSVGKRVRELGTLKALGWTQARVVRQVVGETLAVGIAGGIVGVALGVAASALIGAFAPKLTATSIAGDTGAAAFGLGQTLTHTVTDKVSLTAPIAVGILLIGFGIALAGGLIAGAAGALRAARLRPADALRTVE